MRRFYFKIALIFSAILILFSFVVAYISTSASSSVVQEAMQDANRNLAASLVEEFQPMFENRFDEEEIEKRLTELSGMNPQFDFYVLGDDGKIKSIIPASREKVDLKSQYVDTEPLDKFIANASLPILAEDPLDPSMKKPFSASHVSIIGSEGCYIYVVLEGEKYTQAASMLSDSYITRSSLTIMALVLTFTLASGLLVFYVLTRRLNKIKTSVSNFERGQLSERIDVEGNDELTDLANCFNRMADTLVENMEEIKKADKLRRELIANVSHDLRSPLASIQGYLETILMRGENISKEEYKEYINTVLGNTAKLNGMINDLFDLAKLEAENVQPNLEPISVAELVQDLSLQFKPIARKKGIALEVQFPENPNALITADMGLMNRAITNLLDNAIKHTPEGGKVTISSIQNGEEVFIEVSDTGPGISKDDIPLIFDRFYQVDKSRSNGTGAGLGLSIAQKIFALHNANLSVESLLQKGTTFRVSMPSQLG